MLGQTKGNDNAASLGDCATKDKFYAAPESDDKKPSKSLVHLICRMVSDLLLAGLFLSTILSLVQIHNSATLLTRAAKKPKQFFAVNSSVRDYYTGNVFTAFQDATFYESAFIMFYAPWDRECMEAREVVEEVAAYFSHSDLMVASVNCWYPTSDCAKEFGGTQFPVFIHYPKLLNGVQYRGPVRPDYIIQFIQNARYPLIHVGSHAHFRKLQSEYSSILLGYLPETSTYLLDTNHIPLLKASQGLLEAYPLRSVAVAAVTSHTLARQLEVDSSRPVRLFTWNTSYVYPNSSVDGERVAGWSLRHHQPPAGWANLVGRKSLHLYRLLADRPTLLLFASRSPLGQDAVDRVLREVSIEYLNCDSRPDLVRAASEQSGDSQHVVTGNSCHVIDGSCHVTDDSFRPGTVLTSSSSSCSEDTADHQISSHNCQLRSWSYDSRESTPSACSTVDRCRLNSTLCDNREKLLNSLKSFDVNVRQLLDEVAEENRRLSERYAATSPTSKRSQLSVEGLACRDNRSLSILGVDSNQYKSLLYSLGLDRESLPLPVIVSVEEETVYLPPPSLRMGGLGDQLREVVLAWHRGQLQGSPGFRSTHRERFVRHSSPEVESAGHSVVGEVGSAHFAQQVLSSPGDVVLLYTSSFCAHCTVASHVFHSAKLHLAQLDSVRFLIVDAAKNDLNWEFTALSYPTVIVFPKNRSDMSRVFPTSRELNLTNLLSFVLANLGTENRLRLALANCDTACRNKVRLTAQAIVNKLSGEIRRKRLTRGQLAALGRRLNYTKSVLYIVSALQDGPAPQKVPNRFYQSIIDNFLHGEI